MKNLLLILLITSFIGCGYSSRQNEAIGQVKKVMQETPLVCPDYVLTDISLGVMVNGVGSMSHEDLWFYVSDSELIKTLKIANETGKIVKIKYDMKRITWCVPPHVITSVEIMETK